MNKQKLAKGLKLSALSILLTALVACTNGKDGVKNIDNAIKDGMDKALDKGKDKLKEESKETEDKIKEKLDEVIGKEKDQTNPNPKQPNEKPINNGTNDSSDIGKNIDTAENNEIGQKWNGNHLYPANNVKYIKLTTNSNAQSESDHNFTNKEELYLELAEGRNVNKDRDYHFMNFNNKAYYGYYYDTVDMNKALPKLVYAYDEGRVNNKVQELNQLDVTFEGNMFYTTSTIPEIPTRANVYARLNNGDLQGAVTHRASPNSPMFTIKKGSSLNEWILTPHSGTLINSTEELITGDKSPHKAVFDMKYIKDGKNEVRYVVGEGDNDLFKGVIGAERQ